MKIITIRTLVLERKPHVVKVKANVDNNFTVL